MNPSIPHADPIDVSADNAQNERDSKVEEIRAKVKPIETSDTCLQCDKETQGGKRWCNSQCRDDWQKWNPGA